MYNVGRIIGQNDQNEVPVQTYVHLEFAVYRSFAVRPFRLGRLRIGPTPTPRFTDIQAKWL